MGFTMASRGRRHEPMCHASAGHPHHHLVFCSRPVMRLVCGYLVPGHLAFSVEPAAHAHWCITMMRLSWLSVANLAFDTARYAVLLHDAMSTTSHTPAVQDSSCEPVVLSSASYRDRSDQLMREGICCCSSSISLALHSSYGGC